MTLQRVVPSAFVTSPLSQKLPTRSVLNVVEFPDRIQRKFTLSSLIYKILVPVVGLELFLHLRRLIFRPNFR